MSCAFIVLINMLLVILVRKKQLLLIDVYDSMNEVANHGKDNFELEVTVCAVYGTHEPLSIRTMKIYGLTKNGLVVFIIDSSSSHNFVDVSLVKRLKGQLDTTHTFNVKIADGES